jgi:FtsZ-binding cell division protein ZapB
MDELEIIVDDFKSKIGKLGIEKASVTKENEKLEASNETLCREQTQIANDTAAANEACQSHVVVDPSELEGLQGDSLRWLII